MQIVSPPAMRATVLAICGLAGVAVTTMLCPQLSGGEVRAAEEPAHPAALDDAIIAAAKRHGVPEHLVRRIIMRESKYNPRARNHLYWGLMQISYPTAKSMGFKGTPQELLNPVVNLRYAVPYLANAFIIAGRQEDAAVRLYAAGYYFTARTRGLLSQLRTADSIPLIGAPEEQPPVLASNGVVQPPQSQGIFGALFGPGSQPEPQPTQVAAAYSADASQMQAPAAAPVAAPASSAAVPPGTFNGASVAMVPGKSGDLAPPKKWIHDGGTTLMARGEQGLDQVASRTAPSADAPSTKTSRHKSHKILAFAALDLPPTSAQAYAATPGQDPRFAGTASQAAIAQATSGVATPTGQPTPPRLDAQGQPVDAVPSAALTASADDAKPAKKRVHHARRHKAPDETTQEAQADKPALRDLPVPAPAAQ